MACWVAHFVQVIDHDKVKRLAIALKSGLCHLNPRFKFSRG